MAKLKLKYLVLAGFSTGLIVYYFFYALHLVNLGFTNDFVNIYQAAQALISGKHLYMSVGGYIYPPFFAFMITPLAAHLSEKWVCTLWQGVNISLILLNELDKK